MSDANLAKRLDDVLARREAESIQVRATHLDQAERELEENDTLESIVAEKASSIYEALVAQAKQQIRHRTLAQFILRHEKATPLQFYKSDNKDELFRPIIGSALFGVQTNVEADENAVFGWQLQIPGVVYIMDDKNLSLVGNELYYHKLGIKRVGVKQKYDAKVEEDWFEINLDAPAGRKVKSLSAAEDVEREIMLQAAYQTSPGLVQLENQLQLFSRGNNDSTHYHYLLGLKWRLQQDVEQSVPLAGPMATQRCLELLTLGEQELLS